MNPTPHLMLAANTGDNEYADYGNTAAFVSVILPIYNQEAHIVNIIDTLVHILQSTKISYEIIAVNDGSIDHTMRKLSELQERLAGLLRVISYSPNKGKGYAVKAGVLASQGDVVLFLDSDLEISPSTIMEFVGASQEFDIVIGSKRHPTSLVRMRLTRRVLSKCFSFFARSIAGAGDISDSQVGIKSGKGEIIRKIFQNTTIRRYAFDVEFLMIATSLGLTIKEMPIQLYSNKAGFKLVEIAKMFLDLIKISYRLKYEHWYQKQLATPTYQPLETEWQPLIAPDPIKQAVA